MGAILQVAEFLEKSAIMPVLDVRSPGEYASGHIPNAISFPLFSDEERRTLGILYKHSGKKAAIMKGLELAGPKIHEFAERAEAYKSLHVALYCWRGGMRSENMAWALDLHGFRTCVLQGGYKAYRNYMSAFYGQKLPLIVITGYTGSAKTELLQALKQKGQQVVDLEMLACHQGSSFGNIYSIAQPTTEHFQNLVFEEIRKMDFNRPIWIEDESLRIGQVWLPEGLYYQMNLSPHIFLDVPASQRIERLVHSYGTCPKDKLILATHAISKGLGLEKAKMAIKLIQDGELFQAAKIILTYYDAMYDKSIHKKDNLILKKIKTDNLSVQELAENLINNYGILFDRV